MSVIRVLLLFLSLYAPLPEAVSQEAWPSKVVKIVVPYPSGGEADFIARVMAPKMSGDWGQSVIVENRAGATGNIGTDYVAKSPPNGYTLLLGSDIQFAISPATGVKLPYDATKDFDPISIIVRATLLLLAHPSLPANNVQELIALAKKSPGKINFASTGVGGNDHLGLELLQVRGGFNITHVPYKGQGTAIPDLVAGQVQVAMFGIASTLPHVKAGRLKVLAVTSPQRLDILPDVPTIAESGFPGYEATLTWGLYAPAGTPSDVIAKIQEETVRALTASDIRKRFTDVGQEPLGTSPREVRTRMQVERAKWEDVIRKANIKIEP